MVFLLAFSDHEIPGVIRLLTHNKSFESQTTIRSKLPELFFKNILIVNSFVGVPR